MHSFLHFSRVIYVISYLTISENVMCKMSFCEIWHLFSQAPIRNFPLKNVKTNAVCFKLFWYKVFVQWKLKLYSRSIHETFVKIFGCSLVLRKPLLVRLCVVVWVLCSVFLIFLLRHLVMAPVCNAKKLPKYFKVQKYFS